VRRRGRVQAMTRDQTFGEYMMSAGAWSEDQAMKFRTAETLASAVGGSEMTPSVGLIDLEPGDSLMLCTDGLTKHVTNERIEEVLAMAVDARTMTETLLADALNGGGTDNVSIIVARGVGS
jgi:serine/threonine protein phosphatase PrpC